MQISSETLAILKNFASINSNILINSGNTLKTISPVKNVLAEAVVEENFPTSFGIFDLNKFLSTINLFANPILNFDDNFVTISESGRTNSVKYYYSEPSLLTVPTKELNLPDFVINFELKQTDFGKLTQAVSTLSLPDLSVETQGDKIALRAFDKSDPTSNDYSVVVGDSGESESFCMIFKVENLKLLPGDYTVNICERSVAKFNHKDHDVNYCVALEPDTKYGN